MTEPHEDVQEKVADGEVTELLQNSESQLQILKFQLWDARDETSRLQNKVAQLELANFEQNHLLQWIMARLLVVSVVPLSLKLQGASPDSSEASAAEDLVRVQLQVREILRDGFGVREFDSGVAGTGCIHVQLDYLVKGGDLSNTEQLLSDFVEMARRLRDAAQYTKASLQFGPLQLNVLQPGPAEEEAMGPADRGGWKVIARSLTIDIQSVTQQGNSVRIAGANLAGGSSSPANICIRVMGKLQSTIPVEAWRVYDATADIRGNQAGEVSEVEFRLEGIESVPDWTLEVSRHGFCGVATLGKLQPGHVSDTTTPTSPDAEMPAGRDLLQSSGSAVLVAPPGGSEQELHEAGSQGRAGGDITGPHTASENQAAAPEPQEPWSQPPRAVGRMGAASRMGVLDVHLQDALQLPIPKNRTLMGVSKKLSPYIVLKIGSEVRESAICKGGDRNPTFNERFQFQGVEKDSELILEVYHKSTLSGSVLLGTGKLPPSQITTSNSCQRLVHIVPGGQIRVHITFSWSNHIGSLPSDATGQSADAAISAAVRNMAEAQSGAVAPLPIRSSLLPQMSTQAPGAPPPIPQAVEAQKYQNWLGSNGPNAVRPHAGSPSALSTRLSSGLGIGENGRDQSGSVDSRNHASPTKAASLRQRMKQGLGLGGKPKGAGKGSNASPESSLQQGISGAMSDLSTEPKGTTPRRSEDGNSPLNSREHPLHPGLSGETPATSTSLASSEQRRSSGLAGSREMPDFPGMATAPSDRSSVFSEQAHGIPLAPVEAVRYNLDGNEGWLSRWEANHNNNTNNNSLPNRRSTESSMNFDDGPRSHQSNRRRTDSSGEASAPRRMEAPVVESGRMGPTGGSHAPAAPSAPRMELPVLEGGFMGAGAPRAGEPPQPGYQRWGAQYQEWGERRNEAPHRSDLPMVGRPPSFMEWTNNDGWEGSHQRTQTRVQETSHEVSHMGPPGTGPSRLFPTRLGGRGMGDSAVWMHDRLGGPQPGGGAPAAMPPLLQEAQAPSGGINTSVSATAELDRRKPTARMGMDTANSQGLQDGREGEDPDDDLRVTPRVRSGSAPPSKSRPVIPATASPAYPQPQFNTDQDLSDKFRDINPSSSPPPPFQSALLHRREEARSPGWLEEHRPSQPVSASSHRRKESDDTPATPRGRPGSGEDTPFGDTARFTSNDSAAGRSSHLRSESQEERADQQVESFKGIPSPFAMDDSPLEAEAPSSSSTRQEDSQGAGPSGTSYAAARSGGVGAAGRVPIKEVQEQMAEDAPASIRNVPPRKAATAADQGGKPSWKQMLSEDKDDWVIPADMLDISMDAKGNPIKLGSGAFGTVYKGVYGQSTMVAIKTLKYDTQKDMEEALYEVAILKKQLHPNILQFLGACILDDSIQLVTELMAGNLYKALRNGNCTWYKGGKTVARNIASALAFMHMKGVVHLDVKSANILLTSNNEAKVGDLGLSAMVNKDSFVQTMKGLGTLQWASPEVLLGNHPVTSASDVYSFGTVLWEICTGEVPQRPLRRINDPDNPNEAPKEVVALMERCLAPDPADRPKMKEVYQRLMEL